MHTICLLTYLFVNNLFAFSDSDSVTRQHTPLSNALSYRFSCAGSCSFYNNWEQQNAYQFVLATNNRIGYDSVGAKLECHFAVQADLAFAKNGKPGWEKTSDLFDLHLEWMKSNAALVRNTLNIHFTTQFLSDYKTIASDSSGSSLRWAGGFCNPFLLDLAYAKSLQFWTTCRINILLVDLHTSLQPLSGSDEIPAQAFVCNKNAALISAFGVGLDGTIQKQILPRIRWENTVVLFLNAIHPGSIRFDFNNRIFFRLFRFLNLSINSALLYQPQTPYQMQFKSEILLNLVLQN